MLQLDGLKEITDGDQALLDDLLKTFIHTTREDMLNLKTAISNRQNPLIASVAHRIKGAAAIVGAAQLVAMAGDMEKSGTEASEDHYDLLFTSMQDNFTAIESLYPGF